MNSLLVVVVLADDAPRNTGPDFGKASPLGLLVIVLLLIGTFLLVRSMNRHLGKLPESFDPDTKQPDQAVGEGGVDPSAAGNGSADEPTG
jgi:hypothetical protein